MNDVTNDFQLVEKCLRSTKNKAANDVTYYAFSLLRLLCN